MIELGCLAILKKMVIVPFTTGVKGSRPGRTRTIVLPRGGTGGLGGALAILQG